MHEGAAGMLARSADEVAALQSRLAEIRARHPSSEPRMVADVVCAVLSTMRGDLTAHETGLLAEVEELGQTIAAAKAEIAALHVDDINASHIPSATDELDAIVAHTATATERILETCETLDQVAETLGREDAATPAGAAAMQLQGRDHAHIRGLQLPGHHRPAHHQSRGHTQDDRSQDRAHGRDLRRSW